LGSVPSGSEQHMWVLSVCAKIDLLVTRVDSATPTPRTSFDFIVMRFPLRSSHELFSGVIAGQGKSCRRIKAKALLRVEAW
jgi:hypothetical protein